jgi:Rrf2 family nitric oxide-sensitive transcriptional repressor
MRLSAFTDYSLRILMLAAIRAPSERPTVAAAAATFGISRNHLMKVVHHLAKAGWLDTSRGRGGGLSLARPASEITVGEIVRSTERELGPALSFDCAHCVIAPACRLSGVVEEAADAFYGVLDRYSIDDLVANPQIVRLLRNPATSQSQVKETRWQAPSH